VAAFGFTGVRAFDDGRVRYSGPAYTGLPHYWGVAGGSSWILRTTTFKGALTDGVHTGSQTLIKKGGKTMFRLSDLFILLAVAVSFAVSGFLWFNGHHSEGLFTAIWVPSILAFGIYFKISVLSSRSMRS
jgi:hypothetical protein